MSDISNSADAIDIRDVIARVEELRTLLADPDDSADEDTKADIEADTEELATLEALLNDLSGPGGDEQWEGAWYPSPLIRETYFESYAQELAEDWGKISHNPEWPHSFIDWERAARVLQTEYSSVEYDGVTYWYR